MKKRKSDPTEDPFENGDVLKWRNSGMTFVALKIGRSWYTTSHYSNHIPGVTTFPKILEALNDMNTSNIEYASKWEKVFRSGKVK